MTENEAIDELNTSIDLAKRCTENPERKREVQGYETAIKAIEEIQQYRAIGTVEECRAAMEKQKPKKPVMDGYCCFESYECPTCHHDISNEQKYCDKCGQKLGDDEE